LSDNYKIDCIQLNRKENEKHIDVELFDISGSSHSFLKIDDNVTPVIELDNDQTENLNLKPIIPKRDQDITGENVISLGNQTIEKRIYAKRRDVIYKNLIRSIRRFMMAKFNEDNYGCQFSRKTRGCEIFKVKLEIFWVKHFSSSSPWPFAKNFKCDDDFIQILATFMTSSYFIPRRPAFIKKIAKSIKSAVKTFSPKTYFKFFAIIQVSGFFAELKESGFLDKMIEESSNLKASKDVYERAIDSIINFREHPELMK
jgi:hypothetical protein